MELSKQEKKFLSEMFHIWSKRFKINFQNGKWNDPNRKLNYFSHFQASDLKTFWNFLIWFKGFKISFQNRKWNHPNRKLNYFSHFQDSDQKASFTKCFSLVLRGSIFTYFHQYLPIFTYFHLSSPIFTNIHLY